MNKTILGAFIAFLAFPAMGIAQSTGTVSVTIDPTQVTGHISDDFIGFGYETSAVAQPEFFSPRNEKMIRLYDALSPHGLIRIGGNVSDHALYIADGKPIVHSQSETTIINRKSLNDLGAFAKATGWRVIWGLNLGTGTREQAVDEAVDVTAALGQQLHSFQIGNEVDFLPKFHRHYDEYHQAFTDYKAAIRTALPASVFSGPDVANNLDWCTHFAADESRDLQLLTHHYYVGDAGQKDTSVEKMLRHDDRWEARLKKLQQLSKDSHVPYRINEVNSFSGGGKAGISDTFASALWCLDYLFELASYDCSGVNIETDINHLAWISHYSPIVHDEKGTCFARPEYYGMLAFAMAGKGELLKTDVSQTPWNITAYATRDEHGALRVTAINKELDRDLTLSVATGETPSSADVYRLAAPTPLSTDKVTFGESPMAADGSWSAKSSEKVVSADRVLQVMLPRASAAVIEIKPKNR